jgi:hypothetical protein
VNSVAWQPIGADQLRLGHFLRIGDRWFDHPFLQSRFRITTADELALLRAAGLSQLFVDPARSQVAARPAGALSTLAAGAAAVPEIADAVAGAARLKSGKATHTADVRRTRENLVQARADYLAAVDGAGAALAMLDAGDAQGVEATRGAVRAVLALAAGRERPLTLAPVAAPVGAGRRQACLSMDAAALAAAVGRRLKLGAADLQTLTMAAMLHSVGLSRVPPPLHDESHLEGRDAIAEFREYPRLGAGILREYGEFPPEVIRIVLQHRERLDGSGYPARDSGEAIHPLALVIGAIREFQVRATHDGTTLPAAALAHLYRNLRGACGATAVEHVIAALTVYPPGSFLALADGSIARVVRVSEQARLAPMVCLHDESLPATQAEIIDLSQPGRVAVERVLAPAALPPGVLEYFGGDWAGLTFPAPVAPPMGARPPRLRAGVE